MYMVELQEKISPEEEIKKLEQQLEQKKRALTEMGSSVSEEKELFREVIKEHIESLGAALPQAPISLQPSASVGAVPIPESPKITAKQQEVNEANVRMLVETALTGTIEDAVKKAQELGPYILKELHNHLVDDLYDKLVALRKIKQL